MPPSLFAHISQTIKLSISLHSIITDPLDAIAAATGCIGLAGQIGSCILKILKAYGRYIVDLDAEMEHIQRLLDTIGRSLHIPNDSRRTPLGTM